MEKYIIDERTGWKYELVGDYYLPIEMPIRTTRERHPASTVSEASSTAEMHKASTPEKPAEEDVPLQIGRFGRTHGEYLKRTQRSVYSKFVAEYKLGTYLSQIDEQANSMLELLIRQMAEREGVTEELKATDQMEWVRLINNIRNRAEEIVNAELIYS